jgi:hypothetical protein
MRVKVLCSALKKSQECGIVGLSYLQAVAVVAVEMISLQTVKKN